MSVDFNPSRMMRVLGVALQKAVDSLTLEIAGDIEENVLRKKTNPGPRYANPSLPGNPPAVRTGQLANRMAPSNASDFQSTRKPTEIRAVVFNDAPYAIFLEFGTRFMAARPFLLPSMTKRKNRYKKILGEEIRFEINKVVAK
jgi:HK97 gp10 family phage protein